MRLKLNGFRAVISLLRFSLFVCCCGGGGGGGDTYVGVGSGLELLDAAGGSDVFDAVAEGSFVV